MTHFRKLVAVCCLICGAWPTGFAAAAYLPTLEVDELVERAEWIVVAEPEEAAPGGRVPSRYRVVEVLRGKKPLDRSIEVANAQDFRTGGGWGRSYRPIAAYKRTILYLVHRDDDGRPRYRALAIHALDASDTVLRPSQFDNPGPYYMSTWSGMTWNKLLKDVRATIPRHEPDIVAHLESLYGDLSPRGPNLGLPPRPFERRFLDFEAPSPWDANGLPIPGFWKRL